jgi:FKBP-type peptidyl-prolyl cis-trans isomerase (trigger factor)
MKWEQHSNNDGCNRLKVEADWSELAVDYDDILAEYSKVRLPGFRPGKVPRSVIEKRFKTEIIEDLSHRAAKRLGCEAVRESGAETLGAVKAEEIECDRDKVFRATVSFQPMPKIDLPDIKSLIIDDSDSDPRDQISLKLLDLVDFKVPDELVKEELALEGTNGNDSRSAEWKAAKDRIKLMLILKQIAQQEGIEINEADVNERIAEKADEFGTTTKSLQAEFAKTGDMQQLSNMLLAESTLDYLLEINESGE